MRQLGVCVTPALPGGLAGYLGAPFGAQLFRPGLATLFAPPAAQQGRYSAPLSLRGVGVSHLVGQSLQDRVGGFVGIGRWDA